MQSNTLFFNRLTSAEQVFWSCCQWCCECRRLHRWFPASQRDLSPLRSLHLYTGLGAGFSIPHIRDHWESFHTLRTFVSIAGLASVVIGALTSR
jgi:hypothetical protein